MARISTKPLVSILINTKQSFGQSGAAGVRPNFTSFTSQGRGFLCRREGERCRSTFAVQKQLRLANTAGQTTTAAAEDLSRTYPCDLCPWPGRGGGWRSPQGGRAEVTGHSSEAWARPLWPVAGPVEYRLNRQQRMED
eukprot:scaffold66990_cov24-Prasinocladus_malaysianus.AAC.2